MDRIISFALYAIYYVGLALCVLWLTWKMWCWTISQVWTSAPSNIAAPDFWLFGVAFAIAALALRIIFGNRSE